MVALLNSDIGLPRGKSVIIRAFTLLGGFYVTWGASAERCLVLMRRRKLTVLPTQSMARENSCRHAWRQIRARVSRHGSGSCGCDPIRFPTLCRHETDYTLYQSACASGCGNTRDTPKREREYTWNCRMIVRTPPILTAEKVLVDDGKIMMRLEPRGV